ncbi:hypothetical protein lerEdw1_012304, partial [Lerista edwardsae]
HFEILLEPDDATEGFVQVKMNHQQETYICGHGWGMNEANVACRQLGFPNTVIITGFCVGCVLYAFLRGADRAEVGHPENVLSECLKVTCRGIEMTLAECTLSRANRTDEEKLAKVVCYTRGGGDAAAEENVGEETEANEESLDEERKKIKASFPKLQCGVLNHTITRRKRILGGYEAEQFEFPWQVGIRYGENRLSCGGTYIGGCWVLTAAHCVRASRVHHYRIWTGMLSSINVTRVMETYVLNKIIVHENYNAKTYENDIALLELKPKDIRESCHPPESVPVCVPWSQYMFRSGHQCKVSGWGLEKGK